MRSTGYNQSWAQEISKAGRVCFFLIQLLLRVRIRLCCFQCSELPQRARVPSSPSVIKYKYCKELAVWGHRHVLGDRNFASLVREKVKQASPSSGRGCPRVRPLGFCVSLLLFITLTKIIIQRNQRAILAAKPKKANVSLCYKSSSKA